MQVEAGRRASGRAIGWLIGGGAAMVLLWLALPHPARVDDAAVIALVVATWALAGALLAGALDRAPTVAVDLVLASSALLVSGTLVAIGDPASGFAIYYA